MRGDRAAMPTVDDLNPTSLTRLLARSLLLEALGMPSPPPDPSPASTAAPVQAQRGRETYRTRVRQTYWTRARTLAVLRDFVARTGAFPTHSDFRHARALALPSRPTVIRQWGSVRAVRTLLETETIS